jgi:hypothetical protein
VRWTPAPEAELRWRIVEYYLLRQVVGSVPFVQACCDGKVVFDSLALAELAARRRKGEEKRQPYRCTHCHRWHIGTHERGPRA